MRVILVLENEKNNAAALECNNFSGSSLTGTRVKRYQEIPLAF